MKAKDIVLSACDFTANIKLKEAIQSSNVPPQWQLEQINRLVDYLNFVINEIAGEYIPLKKKQKVFPNNFRVEYSEFEEQPLDIYSVIDKFGRTLRFKKFPTYLLVFANEATVIYNYQPAKVSLEEHIDFLHVPERILAYGVAREYYFDEGSFSDFELWENRFKNALELYCRRKSPVTMKGRRWF